MRRDTTHLVGDLWIGSAPLDGADYRDFRVIVFCAEEYQPPAARFPGIVVRGFPFDDSATPSARDIEVALAGGAAVAADLARRRRTLVTCRMGRNRSAFVCALGLHFLTGEPAAAWGEFVRGKRRDPTGVRALSNDAFRRFLRSPGLSG